MAMKNCKQFENQTVYDHGISVNRYLHDLLNHLRNGDPLKFEWKIPEWIYTHKDLFLNNLPDDETLNLYTIWHDCAKPFVLCIDDNGKRHFPNHAEISAKIFSEIFDNNVAHDLILHDMDIHKLKSGGIEEFCKNKYHLTSLLVGLCEINSNCQLFGGIQSESFKIKFKSISKMGQKIIQRNEK